MTDNKILEVSKDVQWVGALDPDLITFDIVMETRNGTTYNSYFIGAEKKTIVDTVKENYGEVYIAKLKQLTDLSDIQYIIVNHTEPDHSGSLRLLLKHCPLATVIGSGNAIHYLRNLLGFEFPNRQVKDGDTLDLGNKTLRFVGAPNLHWPDTIYTYLVEEKILFTCDSFGSHYCHPDMFDDMVGNFDDAFKYYFDVIMKHSSRFMLQALERIKLLEIRTICPGHGPIYRTNWQRAVKNTEEFALDGSSKPIPHSVLIAYVSAYHNTGLIAEKITEGLKQAGIENIDICDIEKVSLQELEEKVINASALLVGSPTINQNTLLQVYQLFAVINPLRDRNKLVAAFGSYGWSGEATRIIEANLVNLKLKLFGESLTFKFTPHEEEYKKCRDFGATFGIRLLEQKK